MEARWRGAVLVLFACAALALGGCGRSEGDSADGELAAMGAMIEQSACLFIDSRFNVFPPEELKAQVDAAGVANSSMGSDLGQVDNPSPVEGMRQIIAMLLALGFSDEDVGKMVRDNPARLVGLES